MRRWVHPFGVVLLALTAITFLGQAAAAEVWAVSRANENVLRFGTNDSMHILLMRYGFLPEDIDELLPYIQALNETEIRFKDTIATANPRLRKLAEWYT